jgi:hypothetical protein
MSLPLHDEPPFPLLSGCLRDRTDRGEKRRLMCDWVLLVHHMRGPIGPYRASFSAASHLFKFSRCEGKLCCSQWAQYDENTSIRKDLIASLGL